MLKDLPLHVPNQSYAFKHQQAFSLGHPVLSPSVKLQQTVQYRRVLSSMKCWFQFSSPSSTYSAKCEGEWVFTFYFYNCLFHDAWPFTLRIQNERIGHYKSVDIFHFHYHLVLF